MRDRERTAYVSTGRELFSEAGVLLFTALVIWFFNQRTPVMSIAMGLIIVFRFVFLNRRGDWVFLLMGIALGGGNDVMSMYKGVYWYTPPTILPVPIPVWMLFFWGEAFIFFRKLMRYGPFLGPGGKPPAMDLPLAVDIGLFIIMRIIIYRWASTAWLPDAAFAGIMVARLLVLPPAAHERRLLIAILILGPAYEAVLIGCGLYVYRNPLILGVPLWLIIWWVFIFRVLKAVTDRIEHLQVR